MADPQSLSPKSEETVRIVRYEAKECPLVIEKIRSDKRTGKLEIHFNQGGMCVLTWTEKSETI